MDDNILPHSILSDSLKSEILMMFERLNGQCSFEIVIPAPFMSFPRPLCHSRALYVIPAPFMSFPRRRESTLCSWIPAQGRNDRTPNHSHPKANWLAPKFILAVPLAYARTIPNKPCRVSNSFAHAVSPIR